MPNHAHLLLVPHDEDGLRSALSKVHRTYAGIIHAREQKSGHFWQGRFGSVALDEDHLLSAFRYVALNPVRAGLVKQAAAWRWASTRAYLSGEDDGVSQRGPILSRFPDIHWMFDQPQTRDLAAFDRLRKAGTIGRQLGSREFVEALTDRFGRALAPSSDRLDFRQARMRLSAK